MRIFWQGFCTAFTEVIIIASKLLLTVAYCVLIVVVGIVSIAAGLCAIGYLRLSKQRVKQ